MPREKEIEEHVDKEKRTNFQKPKSNQPDRSFKEEFQDRFLKKVLDCGAINNRTGEFIWWELTQEVGLELKGKIYNLRSFKKDFEGKVSDEVKIIHLINAANVWFFRMHKFFRKVDEKHENQS